MLFSLSPKRRREELFNREKELDMLFSAVDKGRIVILDGLRRIGKTSLLRVFLEESNNYHIFIDCRAFMKNGLIDIQAFDRNLLENIQQTLKKGKLSRLLDMLSSISVSGVQISFNNRGTISNLASILEKINNSLKKKKFVLAFDEAQYLKFYGRGGKDFLNLLAYVYDNLENIVFILTGSEVGLLHDFLRVDDPNEPLYGRFMNEITLERFSRDKSLEFLAAGFKEAGIEISGTTLEKAVDRLDGIVGYLSMYGYISCERTGISPDDSLEKATEMAMNLVKQEIQALVDRSSNYGYVLKAISFEINRYSKIKEFIELNHGRISDPTLSKILNSLVKQSFIGISYHKSMKSYFIPDPIVKLVCRELD
ncbi:AAA family ATPase [Kosmotoga pacifica]|uniref:Uncharacterized protein n=1 Tax=Kosmotoga pacifica TaxID=1330330 RepID=A0A0G2Z8G6_9BACT|nr:ATP-binding protein [Kosmotoga pacifica]AKI97862.1 hypothetical protein IX53_08610 [Kosmotoga pacifica]